MSKKKKVNKKLWGGRFKKKIDNDFFVFQKSIQYDYTLALYDMYHSMLHILALGSAGIITDQEADKLLCALNEITKEIKGKKFKPDLNAEDIHTDIQNRITKKCGKLAKKLHTLRSRNDQIVFDEKFYCLVESSKIEGLLTKAINALKALGKKYKTSYIVGYTHTQRAQKVSFLQYAEALSAMLERDKERLLQIEKKTVINIGSGAFKGTALTKNYEKVIKEFLKANKLSGDVRSTGNPIDNVSDRDFMVEFLNTMSIIQMHLSRLAEDFILYSTKEFNFLELPEEFCTGSSLMPHKKNPDFLELVRGYTGRVYGNLVSLLTTMKGLPLTYNRDMQLDKEPLFSSVDIIKDELKILAKFIKGVKLNKAAINSALEDENLYATELAEYLVFKKVPFQDAHQIVGKLIRYAEDNNCKIKKMSNAQLKKFSGHLNKKAIEKTFK